MLEMTVVIFKKKSLIGLVTQEEINETLFIQNFRIEIEFPKIRRTTDNNETRHKTIRTFTMYCIPVILESILQLTTI